VKAETHFPVLVKKPLDMMSFPRERHRRSFLLRMEDGGIGRRKEF